MEGLELDSVEEIEKELDRLMEKELDRVFSWEGGEKVNGFSKRQMGKKIGRKSCFFH